MAKQSETEAIDVDKMRRCSYLLPDPGGRVVRECLDEIERLQALLRDDPSAAKQWTCPCGYMNIGPICTKCGREPPVPLSDTAAALFRHRERFLDRRVVEGRSETQGSVAAMREAIVARLTEECRAACPMPDGPASDEDEHEARMISHVIDIINEMALPDTPRGEVAGGKEQVDDDT